MTIQTLITRYMTTLAVAMLALSAPGCDKNKDGDSKEAGAAKAGAEETPTSLGKAAGAIYIGTVESLVKALGSKPEPAKAKTLAEAILHGAKKKLVVLGTKREAMKPAGRAVFDKEIIRGMIALPKDTFKQYAELQMHYATVDPAVATAIGEANVVTLFTNFDLVKKQDPAGAKKYGVK